MVAILRVRGRSVKHRIQFSSVVIPKVAEPYQGVVDITLYEPGNRNELVLRMEKADIRTLYEALGVLFERAEAST